MGLLGGVFDDGIALCHDGGHHDVHGSTHGDDIQIDVGTVQTAGFRRGVNKAALYHHLGAQGGKAFDVLINGAHAEVASAGHGDFRLTKAAQQGTDQVVGGTDFAGQFIAGPGRVDMTGVNFHSMAVDGANVSPQLFQNAQTERHIGNLRNVFNAANPVHQKGGGDDGNGGVFRAADFDLSKQGLSALYNILSQSLTLSLKEQILLYRLASRDRPMVVRTVYPRGQKTYPRGNKRSDSGRPAAPAGAGIAGRNEQRRESGISRCGPIIA